MPDVIKGMWFCICHKFFEVSPGKVPVEYPIRQTKESEKKVSQSLIDIVIKGEEKVRNKFTEKLHECFPSYRLTSFESTIASTN